MNSDYVAVRGIFTNYGVLDMEIDKSHIKRFEEFNATYVEIIEDLGEDGLMCEIYGIKPFLETAFRFIFGAGVEETEEVFDMSFKSIN